MDVSSNLRQLKFMKMGAKQEPPEKRETLGTWILQELQARAAGSRGRNEQPGRARK